MTLLMSGCTSDPHAEMRAGAERIDQLAHDIAREITAYCGAESWATPACSEATGVHEAALMAALDEVADRAARMDDYLREVGSSATADTACAEQAMTTELVRYAALACSQDAPDTKAAEHCAVMVDDAAQLHARANAVFAATRESVRVGGSGTMPAHLQPLPSGEHPWPWSAGEEPVAHALCGG